MKSERLQRLTKYIDHLHGRLLSTTLPAKHAHREKSYKQFLERELAAVTKQIENIRLTGGEK